MTRTFRDFLEHPIEHPIEHLTDEQKEQIINDSIRMQNMQFKKFSSLENTYRANLIEKVVEDGKRLVCTYCSFCVVKHTD